MYCSSQIVKIFISYYNIYFIVLFTHKFLCNKRFKTRQKSKMMNTKGDTQTFLVLAVIHQV